MLFHKAKGGFGKRLIDVKVHWRKLGVPSIIASHWLSSGSLSLAKLLLGDVEPLPLAVW